MKTTGVSGIPKFGLLDFLGHPNLHLHCIVRRRRANPPTLKSSHNCPSDPDWPREGANPDIGEAQMLWSPACIVSRPQYSPVQHNARFSAYHLRDKRDSRPPLPPLAIWSVWPSVTLDGAQGLTPTHLGGALDTKDHQGPRTSIKDDLIWPGSGTKHTLNCKQLI